ncbi:MAG: hypothetical protein JWN96_2968 [Mycobacterium sp.]|jgi:hypothetical protein|nr:hypothetical protein [Mycobacterium sp.]
MAKLEGALRKLYGGLPPNAKEPSDYDERDIDVADGFACGISAGP